MECGRDAETDPARVANSLHRRICESGLHGWRRHTGLGRSRHRLRKCCCSSSSQRDESIGCSAACWQRGSESSKLSWVRIHRSGAVLDGCGRARSHAQASCSACLGCALKPGIHPRSRAIGWRSSQRRHCGSAGTRDGGRAATGRGGSGLCSGGHHGQIGAAPRHARAPTQQVQTDPASRSWEIGPCRIVWHACDARAGPAAWRNPSARHDAETTCRLPPPGSARRRCSNGRRRYSC